tara:strand:- start:238 stop:843 length:606 start_codon:yes stop_codon:yes gene_type:complete
MPLINCPECKSEISDTSLKCKDCGFPIKAIRKDENLKSIGNSTNQIILRMKSYVNLNKSVTKRYISKAWLRLHIVLSIIGGCLLMIFYSIITGIWDLENCVSVLTWPLFYWLCILILWRISKFNNGIISKRWLTGHTIINLCISIILIIYVFNFEDSYKGNVYRPFDESEPMVAGQLSFFLYYFILYIAVWLINGFKQNEA